MPTLPKPDKKPWIREADRMHNPEIRDSQHFYNSRTWRNTRKQYIMDNPVCIECKRSDMYVPAKVVDHVIPIRSGGAKLDNRNFAPLCEKHHNKKRALEAHGVVQPFKLNDNHEKIPA